jgi:hypothetical protein
MRIVIPGAEHSGFQVFISQNGQGTNMKTVSVYEAEDMVLGHDITRIIPGGSKGPAFTTEKTL